MLLDSRRVLRRIARLFSLRLALFCVWVFQIVKRNLSHCNDIRCFIKGVLRHHRPSPSINRTVNLNKWKLSNRSVIILKDKVNEMFALFWR